MADFRVINDREFNANMRRIASQVATDKEKQSILLAGGSVIKTATTRGSFIPKSNKPHAYYAKAGKVMIMPGNLRKSIRTYRKKDGSVAVGPRVIRKVSGLYTNLGQTQKTASGFYAAALFGSASAFRSRTTDSAAASNLPKMLAAMAKRADKIVQKYVNRL